MEEGFMAYQGFAYYYDKLMDEMPYSLWLRFIRECWAKFSSPVHVVDLGCGTGNIAIPLAQSGFQVTGIDLSEDMLAVAHEKTEHIRRASPFARGGSIQWLCQDMREWELPDRVDCVISFCDSLNYLTEEEDISRTFRQAHKGLKDEGLFIFDVHAPAQLEQYSAEQPFIYNEEELAYIWTCDYDPDLRQIEHELTIFAKSGEHDHFQRIEELHVQRAYSADWIMDELKRAGFENVDCYADFAWKRPNMESKRLFFVARR
jgi:SAM-dependent methyltransferase